MTLDRQVERIAGHIKDAYLDAVPGTVLCIDQLMAEHRTNPDLRCFLSNTADGAVYTLDNGTPTLRLTRERTNPVLRNIEDAFVQLVNEHNYQVLPADFEAVKAAKDTVTIDLTKLGLQRDTEEESYLAVDTSKAIIEYKEEEQKLLRRIYGPTDEDYTANMETLKERYQVERIKVYVLNPEYVQKYAEKGPIARISGFMNVNFYATDFLGQGLYGISREAAEAFQREVNSAMESKILDLQKKHLRLQLK